jgi:hypothetical protein
LISLPTRYCPDLISTGPPTGAVVFFGALYFCQTSFEPFLRHAKVVDPDFLVCPETLHALPSRLAACAGVEVVAITRAMAIGARSQNFERSVRYILFSYSRIFKHNVYVGLTDRDDRHKFKA